MTIPAVTHIVVKQNRKETIPIVFPYAIDTKTYKWYAKRANGTVFEMAQTRDNPNKKIVFYWEESALDSMPLARDYKHALEEIESGDTDGVDLIVGTLEVIMATGD